MGRFIERREPTEPTYIIELTQSEVDVIAGIISDLLDNPQRPVHMDYPKDGDRVKPTGFGMDKLKSAQEAFAPIHQDKDYEYFDYWEEVNSI